MTLAQLEKRVAALEQTVKQIQSQLPPTPQTPVTPQTQRHWWRDDAGRFADDPGFDEIVRLGREYRESLHPDRRKKRRAKKQKKHAGR
jgi:hypothetical protein